MKTINREEALMCLEKLNGRRPYKAMYSTIYDGIVTDPVLMTIPMDEHMVHRGDGVFEAIQFTPKQIFLLEPHIERLYQSADRIGLNVPKTPNEVMEICRELREQSQLSQGILRLFVGRGPGDFSPNPYSTVGSQLYIVVTPFQPVSKEKYEAGVSLMVSPITVKPAPFAQVKSCNYLPNVMMKKESLDRGFDFAVNITEEGYVAEGPTENLMILSQEGELLAPRFDYTLRGTTLVRVMHLARALKENSMIRDIRLSDLTLSDLESAREIMMVGTTLAVLPVTRFEQSSVGDGRVGPVARALLGLLMQDM